MKRKPQRRRKPSIAEMFCELIGVLKDIHRTLRQRREDVGFEYSIDIQNKPSQESSMLEINLSHEQRVKVSVAPKTSKGKPATLDGPVTFTPNDTDVTVETIDDNSAWLSAPDDFVGDRTVVVSADADMGAGVLSIEDTVLLHVNNPMAVNLGLAAETPETKPA